MKTKLTLLAALLFAGASQAALAQEHDHDRWVEPGQRQGPPPAQVQRAAPPPQAAPAQQGQPSGGHWNGGGGEHRWNGGDRGFQPQPQPPAPAPQAAPGPQGQPGGGHGNGGGGEHRWSGGDRDRGDRGAFQPQQQPPAPQAAPRPDQGEHRGWDRGRNGFGPGGTADGDRRWDRRDAPREVVPPGPNGERGWDREHDGHRPAPGYADRPPRGDDRHWDHDDHRWDRDGHWDRDHRGPPENWRHWERGRLPPVYAAPRRYHWYPYHRPYGWYVRSWVFGDILPRGWYGSDYWIDPFWDFDLPYPPPGYHWVRVGDDALLVNDFSGRIIQVVRDIFW